MTTGVVETINTDWRGDTLSVAFTSGGSVLPVSSVVDFDDEVGGWLVVGDSAPLAYTGADEDASTVTLAAPLAVAYEAGTPVNLWDPTVGTAGAQVVEYVATVVLHDGTGTVDAVIPHALIPTSGVTLLEGASVRIAATDDADWYVEAVLGRDPQFDGSLINRIAIGQTEAAAVSETFSGTSLPTGWTATKTDSDGSGSGSPSIPGASVTATGTPAGTVGSALLIDYGPAGLNQVAAGEVTTSLPDAANARIQVRFRVALDGALFTVLEDARLAVRRSDGVAWGATEDSVSMNLVGLPDFTGETLTFPIYVTTNGNDVQIGSVVTSTTPSTAYHFAELQLSAGVISARVWQDGTERPDWMFSTPYAGVAVAGKASVLWRQQNVSGGSRGQKFWVDSLEATNFEEGMYVTETGEGDWSDLRRRILAEVASMIPHVEAGVATSGTLTAGTPADVSVTFAQPFDAIPAVVTGTAGLSNPTVGAVSAVSITKTGFTLRFQRDTGTASFSGHWRASTRTV